MTVYMTSDLHIDHYTENGISIENFINNALLPADVLCVAGDTCDDPNLFIEFYKKVSLKYRKVFTVFGNHDLTIGNSTYFKNNPFKETQKKLDFLKAKLSELKNVSILDGTVEDFEGMKFGGTMAFNDWTWAYRLEQDEVSKYELISKWYYWYDYIHWNYMENSHDKILKDEMQKLDTVIAQKPDVIMTHFIPLFFGVKENYYHLDTTTYFYFNGQKYLEQLKDGSIWLAGHVHELFNKDLIQKEGRVVHLKLNPVGYPDEDTGNLESMNNFLIKF